jgi:hypothetical protein
MAPAASVLRAFPVVIGREDHGPSIGIDFLVHPHHIVLPILNTGEAKYGHDVRAPLSKYQA